MDTTTQAGLFDQFLNNTSPSPKSENEFQAPILGTEQPSEAAVVPLVPSVSVLKAQTLASASTLKMQTLKEAAETKSKVLGQPNFGEEYRYEAPTEYGNTLRDELRVSTSDSVGLGAFDATLSNVLGRADKGITELFTDPINRAAMFDKLMGSQPISKTVYTSTSQQKKLKELNPEFSTKGLWGKDIVELPDAEYELQQKNPRVYETLKKIDAGLPTSMLGEIAQFVGIDLNKKSEGPADKLPLSELTSKPAPESYKDIGFQDPESRVLRNKLKADLEAVPDSDVVGKAKAIRDYVLNGGVSEGITLTQEIGASLVSLAVAPKAVLIGSLSVDAKESREALEKLKQTEANDPNAKLTAGEIGQSTTDSFISTGSDYLMDRVLGGVLKTVRGGTKASTKSDSKSLESDTKGVKESAPLSLKKKIGSVVGGALGETAANIGAETYRTKASTGKFATLDENIFAGVQGFASTASLGGATLVASSATSQAAKTYTNKAKDAVASQLKMREIRDSAIAQINDVPEGFTAPAYDFGEGVDAVEGYNPVSSARTSLESIKATGKAIFSGEISGEEAFTRLNKEEDAYTADVENAGKLLEAMKADENVSPKTLEAMEVAYEALTKRQEAFNEELAIVRDEAMKDVEGYLPQAEPAKHTSSEAAEELSDIMSVGTAQQQTEAISAYVAAAKEEFKSAPAGQLDTKIAEVATMQSEAVKEAYKTTTDTSASPQAVAEATEIVLNSLAGSDLTLEELKTLKADNAPQQANLKAAIATAEARANLPKPTRSENEGKDFESVTEEYLYGNPDKAGHYGISQYLGMAQAAVLAGDAKLAQSYAKRMQSWLDSGAGYVAKTEFLQNLRANERSYVEAAINQIGTMVEQSAIKEKNKTTPKTDTTKATPPKTTTKTAKSETAVSKQLPNLVQKSLREARQFKGTTAERLEKLKAAKSDLSAQFEGQADKDYIAKHMDKEIASVQNAIKKPTRSTNILQPSTLLGDGNIVGAQKILDELAEQETGYGRGLKGSEFVQRLIDAAPSKAYKAIASAVLIVLQKMEAANKYVNVQLMTEAHIAQYPKAGGFYTHAWGYIELSSGEYDVPSNVGTLYVKSSLAELFFSTSLHELVHAVTQMALASNPKLAQRLETIRQLLIKDRDRLAKAQTPLSELEQSIVEGLGNSTDTIDEVVAWGLTHEAMQGWLESIPYKSSSLWVAFKNTIKNLLGYKGDSETLFSEFLSISEELLAASENLDYSDFEALNIEAKKALRERWSNEKGEAIEKTKAEEAIEKAAADKQAASQAKAQKENEESYLRRIAQAVNHTVAEKKENYEEFANALKELFGWVESPISYDDFSTHFAEDIAGASNYAELYPETVAILDSFLAYVKENSEQGIPEEDLVRFVERVNALTLALDSDVTLTLAATAIGLDGEVLEGGLSLDSSITSVVGTPRHLEPEAPKFEGAFAHLGSGSFVRNGQKVTVETVGATAFAQLKSTSKAKDAGDYKAWLEANSLPAGTPKLRKALLSEIDTTQAFNAVNDVVRNFESGKSDLDTATAELTKLAESADTLFKSVIDPSAQPAFVQQVASSIELLKAKQEAALAAQPTTADKDTVAEVTAKAKEAFTESGEVGYLEVLKAAVFDNKYSEAVINTLKRQYAAALNRFAKSEANRTDTTGTKQASNFVLTMHETAQDQESYEASLGTFFERLQDQYANDQNTLDGLKFVEEFAYSLVVGEAATGTPKAVVEESAAGAELTLDTVLKSVEAEVLAQDKADLAAGVPIEFVAGRMAIVRAHFLGRYRASKQTSALVKQGITEKLSELSSVFTKLGASVRVTKDRKDPRTQTLLLDQSIVTLASSIKSKSLLGIKFIGKGIDKVLGSNEHIVRNRDAFVVAGLEALNNNPELKEKLLKRFDSENIEQNLSSLFGHIHTMMASFKLNQDGEVVPVTSDPETGALIRDVTVDPATAAKLAKLNRGFSDKGYLNPIVLFLTKGTDGYNRLNDAVAGTVAMAALNWLATSASSDLYRTQESVAQMFGVTDKSVVPADIYGEFNNKGAVFKLVAHSIGKAVVGSLGVKLNPNLIPVGYYDSMYTAFGTMAIGMLEQTGMVQITPVESTVWQAAINKITGRSEDKFDGNEAVVNLVRIAIDETVPRKAGELYKNTPQAEAAAAIFGDMPTLAQVLMQDAVVKDVATSEPTEQKTTNKGDKGDTLVNSEITEAIDTYNQTPFDVNTSLKGILAAPNAKEVILELLGFTDFNKEDYYEKRQDDQQAVYDNTIREIEDMLKAFEKNSDLFEGSIYMKSAIWVNLRNGFTNQDINPQASKAVRAFVTPSAHAFTVNKDSIEENRTAVEDGLKNAFGVDEKTSPINAKAKLDQVYKAFEDVPQQVAADFYAVAGMNEGGIPLAAIRRLFDWAKKNEIPVNGITGLNALIQAYGWTQLNQKGSEVSTYNARFDIEVDGVTNGFILLAMQFPVFADTVKWLNRGGVFTSNDYESFNEFINTAGNTDAYQTLGGTLVESLTYGRPDVKDFIEFFAGKLEDESGGVTKVVRNLMKPAFMIFNYGASYKRIGREARDNIEVLVYEKLEDIMKTYKNSRGPQDAYTKSELDKATAELATLNHVLGLKGNNQVTFADGLMKNEKLERAIYSVLTKESTKSEKDAGESNIGSLYADMMEDAINEHLKELIPIRDAINNSFKAQWVMYNEMLTKRVADAKAKAEAKGTELTEAEHVAILEELEPILPHFHSPTGTRGTKEKIPVFKTEYEYSKDTGVTVSYRLTDDAGVTGGTTSFSTQTLHEKIMDGGVSGFSIAVHAMDATIMARIYTNPVAKGSVYGKHDATGNSAQNHGEVSQGLNQEVLKLVNEYSLIGDFLHSFTDSVAYANSLGMELSIETLAEVFSQGMELHKATAEVNQGKRDFYGEELTVDQYPTMEGKGVIKEKVTPKIVEVTAAEENVLKRIRALAVEVLKNTTAKDSPLSYTLLTKADRVVAEKARIAMVKELSKGSVKVSDNPNDVLSSAIALAISEGEMTSAAYVAVRNFLDSLIPKKVGKTPLTVEQLAAKAYAEALKEFVKPSPTKAKETATTKQDSKEESQDSLQHNTEKSPGVKEAADSLAFINRELFDSLSKQLAAVYKEAMGDTGKALDLLQQLSERFKKNVEASISEIAGQKQAEALLEKHLYYVKLTHDMPFSSPTNLDVAGIAAGETSSVISGESVKSLLEVIAQNDNVEESTATTKHFADLFNKLLIPALDKLTPTMLKFKSDVTEAGGNFGQVSGSLVSMIQGPQVTTLNAQSGQEVFAHELMHRVTLETLLNDPEFRKKAVEIYEKAKGAITRDVFLKKDQNGEVIFLTDRAAEEAHADLMYDYMFNNTGFVTGADGAVVGKGLIEFVAFGLSNPAMVTKLSNTSVKETEGSKNFKLLEGKSDDSLLVRLFNAMYSAITSLIDRMLGAPKGSDLHQQLFNLAMDMNNLQNQESSKQAARLREMGSRLGSGIDRINSVLSASTDGIGSWINSVGKGLTNPSGDAYASSQMILLMQRLKVGMQLRGKHKEYESLRDQILASENQRVAMDNALKTEINASSEDIISMTLNTVTGRVSRVGQNIQRVFDRMRTRVDRLRETTRKAIRTETLESFHNKTTKSEREALTPVMMSADLSTLVQALGVAATRKLLSTSSARKETMSKLKAELSEAVGDSTTLAGMMYQINGFGSVAAKGVVTTFNQVRSVGAVVDGLGFSTEVSVNDREAAMKIVDQMMSISVLNHVERDALKMVGNLWDREFAVNSTDNGITKILMLQEAGRLESTKLFGEHRYAQTKGYSPQLFDQGLEQKEALVSEASELAKEGWELKITHKTNLGSADVGVYVRKSNRGSKYVQGTISITNERAVGTSIVDTYVTVNGGFVGKDINKIREDARKFYTRRSDAEQRGRVVPKKGAIPLPIFNNNGEIVDYSYIMSEGNKKTVLGKNYDISDVLADLHASAASKLSSKELNKEAIQALTEDYDTNYANNPEEFIWVNGDQFLKDGSMNQFYDQYRMIPYEARKAIEDKWGRTSGLPIRKGMVRLVLGGRKYSLAESSAVAHIQEKFPNMPLGGVRNIVAVAETIWQEVVQVGKVGVVIKTPAVVLINITSNLMLLATNRIDPITAGRDFIEGIREMRKYEKLTSELVIMEARLAASKDLRESEKLRARIIEANTRLDASPMKPLIDEGMFQSIIEELDSTGSGYLDQGVSWANKKLEDKLGAKVANHINAVPQALFMGEKSSVFKLLNKATQYSDIVARYSYVKRESARNVKRKRRGEEVKDINEIYGRAKDMFINYNLPDHAGLDYANAMGVLMFTKYYLGIQHVITSMWKGQPVEAMSSLLGQWMLGDISDIFDDSILNKDPTRVMKGPSDHIDNFVSLYGFDFWKNLSPF